jgi:hypothetical protein
MFVVTLEDGTQLREGMEVQSWDEVPAHVSIAAVTLTDYGQLAYTLSECDYYVVPMHAKAIAPSSADDVVRHPIVESQTLYGIRNQAIYKPSLKALIEQIKQEAVKIGRIEKEGENHLLVEIQSKIETDLKTRFDLLLKNLEAVEVVSVSMGFTVNTFPRSEFRQADWTLRSGMPRGVDKGFMDWVRRFLLSPEKVRR